MKETTALIADPKTTWEQVLTLQGTQTPTKDHHIKVVKVYCDFPGNLSVHYADSNEDDGYNHLVRYGILK